jgi:hypothetical protein
MRQTCGPGQKVQSWSALLWPMVCTLCEGVREAGSEGVSVSEGESVK